MLHVYNEILCSQAGKNRDLQGVVGNGNHYVNQSKPNIERKILNVSYIQILDLNLHVWVHICMWMQAIKLQWES